MIDVDSKEFQEKYKILYEKAFCKMRMRNCHSKQQCLDFYEREGVKFIRYEGEEDGYHLFKEFYQEAIGEIHG